MGHICFHRFYKSLRIAPVGLQGFHVRRDDNPQHHGLQMLLRVLIDFTMFLLSFVGFTNAPRNLTSVRV